MFAFGLLIQGLVGFSHLGVCVSLVVLWIPLSLGNPSLAILGRGI